MLAVDQEFSPEDTLHFNHRIVCVCMYVEGDEVRLCVERGDIKGTSIVATNITFKCTNMTNILDLNQSQVCKNLSSKCCFSLMFSIPLM